MNVLKQDETEVETRYLLSISLYIFESGVKNDLSIGISADKRSKTRNISW